MIYSSFIAALDIGGSMLTLTLSTRTTEGKINVIATETASTGAVKYGRITNEKTLAQEIQSLVLKVQHRCKAIIEKVYVSTGGTMIFSEVHTEEKELGGGSIVTEDIMLNLWENARKQAETEMEEVLLVQPLSYKLDGEVVENIEGKSCYHIESTHLIVKGRRDNLKKIRNTLKMAEMQIADILIAPLAIAEVTLSPKEKALGTAAIEIGESSSKIAVYQAGKLRFASTIPLGTQLIVSDLCTCLDINKKTAEQLKDDPNFGAVHVKLVEDADLLMKNNSGTKKNYASRMVVEIIEARIEEIFLNIMYRLEQSNYMLLLKGGLVISGDVSKIKNLTQFVEMKTNIKVKIADIKPLLEENAELPMTNIDAETCGMLALGTSNCKKEEDRKREEMPEQTTKRKTTKRSFAKGVKGMKDNIMDMLTPFEDDEDRE